jgi:hypothetical protein
MNYKRAIGISILVYLVSMVIGMIACTLLGISPSEAYIIPPEMWTVTAVVSAILAIGGALWYFRGKNLKPSARAGFHFGLCLIIVGFLLDFLFFLSLSFQHYDPFAAMAGYYSEPAFWLTIALILIGSTLVGTRLEKSKKTS